jgi:hypothetical protein
MTTNNKCPHCGKEIPVLTAEERKEMFEAMDDDGMELCYGKKEKRV